MGGSFCRLLKMCTPLDEDFTNSVEVDRLRSKYLELLVTSRKRLSDVTQLVADLKTETQNCANLGLYSPDASLNQINSLINSRELEVQIRTKVKSLCQSTKSSVLFFKHSDKPADTNREILELVPVLSQWRHNQDLTIACNTHLFTV